MLSEPSVKLEPNFDCELCIESYNNYDRRPFSLVPCGHALCLSCINNLQKSICPFCRSRYENKIPNWEIIKRLPKPSIPIIYYQTEIKINSLSSVTNQLYSSLNFFFMNLKDKIQIAIRDNADENNGELNEKLKNLLKNIDNKQQEIQEAFKNLKKNLESLKKIIELEENKYNNHNLKKLKNEIEKLTKNTMEKNDFLITIQSQLDLAFKDYDSKPNEDLVNKTENIFLKFDTTNYFNQHITLLFSISNNNLLNNQVMNDVVSPDEDFDSLSFNTRQKRIFLNLNFNIKT